jgi:SGNH domain (fused to AT3 domains)/Acyltransferase family
LEISNSSAINFYLPSSRVWQFSLGGLIYLLPRETRNQKYLPLIQTILGTSLLILFIPGVSIDFKLGSLLVSIIAALALLTQTLAILPKKISRILEWLGDRSYSIYLVHMPLIYIAKYAPVQFLESNRRLSSITAIILTIYLGNVSYNRFEQRYRINENQNNRKKNSFFKLLLIFILVPGVMLTQISSSTISNVDTHKVYLRGCVDVIFDPSRCLWEAPNSKGLVLIVGDSQVYGNADGIIKAANELGYSVIASSVSGCPFLDIASSGGGVIDCRSWQSQVMDFILNAKPQAVVISNRTNGYLNPNNGWRMLMDSESSPILSREASIVAYEESLERVLAKITSYQIPVVLFQNIPERQDVGSQSNLTKWINRGDTIRAPLESLSVDYLVADRENVLLKKFTSVQILNPISELCPDKICLLVEEGNEIYRDSWHLSEYGSLKLSGKVREVLSELVKA